MLDFIQFLSKSMNGSGNETALCRKLQEFFSAKGLKSQIDATGSLSVFLPPASSSEKIVMITTPLDVPSLVCLYVEKNKGYLASPASLPNSHFSQEVVFSAGGKSYQVSKVLENQDPLFVRGKIQLGEAFRRKMSFQSIRNGKEIQGLYSSRYACLALLARLTDHKLNCGLILHFAAQGLTNAKSEYHAVRRNHPDAAIFLTSVESEEQKPLLVVKDGRSFSDAQLISMAEASRIRTERLIADSMVTKSESVSSCGIKTLTVAIPAKKINQSTESFSVAVAGKCESILAETIRRIAR